MDTGARDKAQDHITNAVLSLLLADDDDSLRESLAIFFHDQGFEVFPARSGTEAVEIAVAKRISFSIMDVNMPGLSGIEAYKSIANEVGTLPCIFMSGDASQEILIRAMQAGAFSFLRKPIQIDIMRRCVDQLIDRFFRSK